MIIRPVDYLFDTSVSFLDLSWDLARRRAARNLSLNNCRDEKWCGDQDSADKQGSRVTGH
jgi:hypothetical protein